MADNNIHLHMTPLMTPLPFPLMTAREAATYLRVSLSTLYRLEKGGQLISLRTPGGHRRYTLQMLNDCLNPPTQIAPAAVN